MQKLAFKAQLYIIATLALGGSMLLLSLAKLHPSNLWLLLILCALAAMAQILKVEGTTNRSSYQISWSVYGFSFVLLGAPETILVILVAHLADWLWHQYQWYIQSFNVASYVVVVSIAKMILDGVSSGAGSATQVNSVVGFMAAGICFTLLNHFMVGMALYLARGERFSQSGVFNLLTLMIDFITFSMGATAAYIWIVNPYAVILILSPLYLIYTTLRVPALEHQTRTDPKTGLYNARYFGEALASELGRANRFRRPLTIVMADVDHLRTINNTYGHLAGDIVLRMLSEQLQCHVKEFDIVGRFGGEEFAILLPETNLQQALPRIEKIRAKIEKMKVDVPTSVAPISVTMSFGVAEREHQDQTADELLHCADLAMYEAKATSRNRVCYYTYGNVNSYTSSSNASDKTSQPVIEPLTEQAALGMMQTDQTPIIESKVAKQPTEPVLERILSAKTPPAALNSVRMSAPSQLPMVAVPNTQTKAAAKQTASNEPAPLTKYVPRQKPAGVSAKSGLAKAPPAWWLSTYIITVALAACLVLAFSGNPAGIIDWKGIFAFAALAFVAEWLGIEIYADNVAVSTSVAPLIAAACIFGVQGALVLSLALAVAPLMKYHSPLNRFVFNTSNHLLAGLLAANFVILTGMNFGPNPGIGSILVLLAATLINYLATTVLLSVALILDSGQSFRQVWTERFGWLWPYYGALGAIAYALAIGYLNSGIVGVVVILIPLLMIRLSQNQYVRRTEGIVSQLRSANDELTKRTQEIAAMNDGLIQALAQASDLRDPHVHGHSQHVARYAVMIANELRLPESKVNIIRQAGLLHDIGKIGIPETILFKPTRLTEEEFAIIKQHVTLGAALVEGIESLQHLAPFIRHHHERIDGKGYPDGLAADQIPLEARIINAADAIEAMASDRPYQKARSAQDIIHELHQKSGTQFDPMVVDAFLKIIEREGESFIVNSASLTRSHLHTEYELTETLLRVAGSINSSLDQQRVLDLILEQLSRVVNYDNASIMLLDGELLHSVARRSIHMPESAPFSMRFDSLPHIRQVVELRTALVIADTQNDERWMKRSGSENIRCWLGVPLVVENRTIGMLNLSISSPGYYNPRHLSVTTAFAAQAAVAIQNANLYSQAQTEITERKRAQEELQIERESLAEKVEQRTLELRTANGELRKALQVRDDFLANVSHELRTPLTAVLMLSESLREGIYGPLQPKQLDILERVRRNGRHLLALINDILDLSKIESSNFTPTFTTVSVSNVCQNSVQMVQEAANAKKIKLHQQISENVCFITADERRLAQILINLLSNAIKFTPENGDVGLDVIGDNESNFLYFTIWDTGIGIKPEDQGRLFQPFVQLDSRLTKKYEGTGLGLALADQLARMHNGSISVESEMGKGSRFTVKIPWQANDQVVPAPEPPSEEPENLLESFAREALEAATTAIIPTTIKRNGNGSEHRNGQKNSERLPAELPANGVADLSKVFLHSNGVSAD
ncbi:MAG: diguanylate cyclase [Caldilineaceae bacterium]